MKFQTFFGVLVISSAMAFTSLPATAADDAPDTADMIIYNARVVTVNSNFTVEQSVAVRDGWVLAVGSDRQVERFRGPLTLVVDAMGRTVMPGLYDAHVTSYTAAVSELAGPQPALESIEAAQDYIRKQAAKTPAGKWIILEHLYPTRLKEGRMPTKAELDVATTNNPVCWNFGPMVVVNSKALELAHITKFTASPLGGEVVKDPKNLNPTGLLRNATQLLHLPPVQHTVTTAQRRDALKRLYHLYNREGITSIGEENTKPEIIDLFRDMSRSNELTVRINCARLLDGFKSADDAVAKLDAMTNATAGKLPYGPTGVGNDWVRIGALKTDLDGDVAVATAYLRTPYGIGPTYRLTEPAYRGELKQDLYVLPEVFLEAAHRGWQLSTRGAGDAALDFLLNCYEQVQFKLDIRDRRFLISHNDFQAEQDWSRCIKLGLGADLQPTCLYEDGTSLLNTLGEKRLDNFLPLKTWFAKGMTIGGGSGHAMRLDSTNISEPWSPWLAMWVAVARETRQGDVINADQQLTREQAIRMYTINNAWLNFEETRKGSIEPGKYADLVMLDRDILKCPVENIRDTKVLFTMVNGKIVWEAQPVLQPRLDITSASDTNSLTNAAGTNAVTVAASTNQATATVTDTNNATAAAATNAVAVAAPTTNTISEVASTNSNPNAGVTVNVTNNNAAVATMETTPVVTITNQPVESGSSNASTTITVTVTITNQTAVPVAISSNAVATAPVVPGMVAPGDSTTTTASNSVAAPATNAASTTVVAVPVTNEVVAAIPAVTAPGSIPTLAQPVDATAITNLPSAVDVNQPSATTNATPTTPVTNAPATPAQTVVSAPIAPAIAPAPVTAQPAPIGLVPPIGATPAVAVATNNTPSTSFTLPGTLVVRARSRTNVVDENGDAITPAPAVTAPKVPAAVSSQPAPAAQTTTNQAVDPTDWSHLMGDGKTPR